MTETKFTSLGELGDFHDRNDAEMTARAAAFFDEIKRRHTVRDFTDEAVPRAVIENCIAAAARVEGGNTVQIVKKRIAGELDFSFV